MEPREREWGIEGKGDGRGWKYEPIGNETNQSNVMTRTRKPEEEEHARSDEHKRAISSVESHSKEQSAPLDRRTTRYFPRTRGYFTDNVPMDRIRHSSGHSSSSSLPRPFRSSVTGFQRAGITRRRYLRPRTRHLTFRKHHPRCCAREKRKIRF